MPPLPRPPPETHSETSTSVVEPFAPPEISAVSEPPPSAKGPARSLELRLGTFWAPRVGIVVLLTGLVLVGNLAYQNLGPLGKVMLLYLASGLLLGAGWWWQRREMKETLKNYAQVLFAGGLAALYFTTYAAHHVDTLRVIQSPLLDGVLLLGCAGFMVGIADRKKSEVLAFFAVGLAYYSSVITRVSSFTLYSNLLLAITSVVFLARNRWVAVSFGSLLATYAAYCFWRFFDGSAWHWASPGEGLWFGIWFLASYWMVFSAAVFLSGGGKFTTQDRAGLLTLNNGAFFTLFLLTMLQVRQSGFWKFSLIYGTVLLVLAEAARRLLPAEPLTKNAYLTQGLLLVTVGFISKFAGLQLAMILAAESVVLLILGQQRKNLVLVTGAYISAALAIGWGIDGMRQNDSAGVILSIGLGAMMVVNTILAHRQTVSSQDALRPQPSYFMVLGLIAWGVATFNNTTREQFPLALAIEGLLLTGSIYIFRIREIPLLAQGYVVLAQSAWIFNAVDAPQSSPWWSAALVLAVSFLLSHWWQKQSILKLRSQQIGQFLQGLYGLAIVGVLYFWFGAKVNPPEWLVLSAALGLGLTTYGVITRAWLLAACAQIFVVVTAAQYAWQMYEHQPDWRLPLAPIAVIGLLSFGTLQWFRNRPEADPQIRQPLLGLAMVYRWAALAMSIAWVWEYIPAQQRIWVLLLLGFGVFLWAGWRGGTEAMLFGAVYSATGLVLFWHPMFETPKVYWPNLAGILLLLAQQRIAQHLPDRYRLDRRVQAGVIFVGSLSLWLYLSWWVLKNASGFYLTASWSLLALALFACGIALRERVYRWLGLGILACALGRIVIFDVWKLETVYRILSFMALGIALLVLGYVYSRFQEKIREWL